MKDQELIDLLKDVSEVDIGWNFGLLRERAATILQSINSDAQAESPNVGDNEDKKDEVNS